MMRLLQGAWVIARRDFNATVLSKAFIFFLLGPLFPLLLGGVFGGIGATVATRTEQPVVAVMFWDSDFHRLSAARDRLAEAMPGPGVIQLIQRQPVDGDFNEHVSGLLQSKDPPVRAVLTGSLDQPHVTGAIDPATYGQLKLILADARAPKPRAPVDLTVTNMAASSGSLAKDRSNTALYGQMLLFFLTILLSGMVLSQLIEEKSNKIIEVIAAAVPIDSMFIGKLFAMLAASVVGILVWVGAGALLIQMLKQGGVHTLPPPAVGWPTFLALAIVYFAMNFLLLGAVFLTIGAQATTAREVQTMSMPVTFAQVLIFGFATTAVGAANSANGIAAAIFPLSSPMVMLARAAEQPGIWPHLLAILWQALWVALILRAGSQLFRKTVLKSGPRVRWWRRSRA
jgi:ABC-2 type transport system permease protein